MKAMWALGIALMIGVGIGGCGWGQSPVYTVGPYGRVPQGDLFNRVSQLLSAQGYQPVTVDPARGQIVVGASYVHRGSASQFTVQLYREGWILVTASGGYVQRRGDGFKMPKALRDEYQALVMSLMNGLGPVDGGQS